MTRYDEATERDRHYPAVGSFRTFPKLPETTSLGLRKTCTTLHNENRNATLKPKKRKARQQEKDIVHSAQSCTNLHNHAQPKPSARGRLLQRNASAWRRVRAPHGSASASWVFCRWTAFWFRRCGAEPATGGRSGSSGSIQRGPGRSGCGRYRFTRQPHRRPDSRRI